MATAPLAIVLLIINFIRLPNDAQGLGPGDHDLLITLVGAGATIALANIFDRFIRSPPLSSRFPKSTGLSRFRPPHLRSCRKILRVVGSADRSEANMIRMEPNVVLKYFDPVDAFVKIRHFTADEVTHLLKTARITDRRSYVGLVVNACVLGLTERHLEYTEDLYQLCIEVNPPLEIHRVAIEAVGALQPDPPARPVARRRATSASSTTWRPRSAARWSARRRRSPASPAPSRRR